MDARHSRCGVEQEVRSAAVSEILRLAVHVRAPSNTPTHARYTRTLCTLTHKVRVWNGYHCQDIGACRRSISHIRGWRDDVPYGLHRI